MEETVDNIARVLARGQQDKSALDCEVRDEHIKMATFLLERYVVKARITPAPKSVADAVNRGFYGK